jgi:molybdopterin synthase catalytic subunit
VADPPPRVRAALVDRPIDVGALVREVESHAAGATVLFIGTVREHNDGRAVTGIEYSAYAGMANRELAAIADEASAGFSTAGVVVEHRLGYLELGEASVAIAVAHERRGAAYEASRYVIEQLKRRVPVWKREHYADGTREWVNPAAPPPRDALRLAGCGDAGVPQAAAATAGAER